MTKAYGEEQAWSSSLPQWTWVLQFLILAPINIVIIGQIALLITSALHQTPADGNPVLPIYLIVAGLTVLLLLPLTPFLHRFTWHIPTFLFFIFVGCLVYNLLAFPFSREARMKHYFVQSVDLDTGVNNVTLTGLDGYVQQIISELPSAASETIHCHDVGDAGDRRQGLKRCSWHGLPPNVVPDPGDEVAVAPYSNHTKKEKNRYAKWLDYTITPTSNQTATFHFQGQNTKAYRLAFHNPVSSVQIEDGATDSRFRTVPSSGSGSSEVHIFSREWHKAFTVNVSWPESAGPVKGQKGVVKALWSDANVREVVPAFDEVRRFEPVWSVVSKAGDGLVEGWREWEV